MRALNSKDARDLLVLLLTLVVMTNLLIWGLRLLLLVDASVTDAWLASGFVLLIYKHVRMTVRSRRRHATSRDSKS